MDAYGGVVTKLERKPLPVRIRKNEKNDVEPDRNIEKQETVITRKDIVVPGAKVKDSIYGYGTVLSVALGLARINFNGSKKYISISESIKQKSLLLVKQ